MAEYVISCCSTADLTRDELKKKDIHYICAPYQLDGVQYYDDLGETMSMNDFYQAMVDGADTKTSQINANEFEAYFRKFLKEGKDVLHFSLSSGISGTVNSATIAKTILEEEFPERKIMVIDSLAASSGFGLLVDKVADLRAEGKTIDEAVQWVEENKKKMHHWFFTSDLTFFIKGGRVSKTSGFIGGILGICPLLNVDFEGKLIPRQKIKGKKKVIKAIVEKMEIHAEGGLDYSGKCYISQSACYEDAKAVADLIEEKFPKLDGKVEIHDIGTSIGSHTGPGTVALFFWGDERID